MTMTIKKTGQAALLAFAFLVTVGAKAQDSRPQTASGPVTVNDLVATPGAHLGLLQLIGVVAAVSEGRGFVLVDPREYGECGLSWPKPARPKCQCAGPARPRSWSRLYGWQAP
jgi:hypothetical protein